MLSCKNIAEQSSEFVDKKLKPKQKLAYFLHLLMCGNCRRYIQHFRLMLKQSRNLQPKSLSDEHAEKILYTIKHASKK